MGYRKQFYFKYNKWDPMERYITPLDLDNNNLIRSARNYPLDLIKIHHLSFYDVNYSDDLPIHIRNWEGTGHQTRFKSPMQVFNHADFIRYTDRRTGQTKILKDRYEGV